MQGMLKFLMKNKFTSAQRKAMEGFGLLDFFFFLLQQPEEKEAPAVLGWPHRTSRVRGGWREAGLRRDLLHVQHASSNPGSKLRR